MNFRKEWCQLLVKVQTNFRKEWCQLLVKVYLNFRKEWCQLLVKVQMHFRKEWCQFLVKVQINFRKVVSIVGEGIHRKMTHGESNIKINFEAYRYKIPHVLLFFISRV
jgi:DnaJ-class molecular chaperone